MFAVLRASPAVPLDELVETAQAFTPRFQVVGACVVLDVSGLSKLFGSPTELGLALQAHRPGCRALALATTVSAAMLLACGCDGLTVLEPADERAALAALPLEVLADVAAARGSFASEVLASRARRTSGTSSTGRHHPRNTHQAQHARRTRTSATPASALAASSAPSSAQLYDTLVRWGIRTLGALAALPRPEVYERLGALGVAWQRLAAGEDDEPLVPWLAEPVFEQALDLEWPVEGFEPLSFVLARLLEPLAADLERADRGAVAIRTALHLTTRAVHVRVVPLPAPMRDPKTLRTLVLLDLESHPPAAAIDRVQVRLEPTPGRVLQWTLFERAQPAPEQVATLVARLTALVGERHVGVPVLVDSWRPGAFRMGPFQPGAASDAAEPGEPSRRAAVPFTGAPLVPTAFRRFRLPIPVRVRVEEGRPVRVTTDRHGVAGGVIVQAAGPWRTSGAWWANEIRTPDPGSRVSDPGPHWDRDEWDIAMGDGTVYRLFVERDVGQWFLEGVID